MDKKYKYLIGETMYLATTSWNSALHIDVMRIFKTEQEAWDYVSTLEGGTPKVYLLSSTNPPKLLKRSKQ